MRSLFSISNELNAIFYAIEEADGEITPEIEARLAISQDNLKDKCKAYIETIKHFDSDINDCKNEIKRIKAYSESKDKNKTRITNTLMDAIIAFGNTNGKGAKFIDLGTCKAQIRETSALGLNDVLIQAIIESFFNYCKSLYDNNELGNYELDEEFILDYINVDIKNNMETSYLLFAGTNDEGESVYNSITVNDLSAIKVKLTTSCRLTDLFKSSFTSLIEGHIDADYLSSHVSDTDKTSVKNLITLGQDILIGKMVYNNNLNIK